MIPAETFPALTSENHRITSPPTPDYNCIAWSAHDETRWWEPGRFWPVASPPNDYGIGVLIQAFVSLGYEECGSDGLEEGYEKVVLYGSALCYTHAARQLPSGKWTSKLGRAEDIEHDTPEAVAGPLYGDPIQFMRRKLPDQQPPIAHSHRSI